MPSNYKPQDLQAMPGHYIRKLQQIAVAAFMQSTQDHQLTPVQFAALLALRDAPGIDQRSLGNKIAIDASTIGGVVDRLEDRALVVRALSTTDRRAKHLKLSSRGKKLLAATIPSVLEAQELILAPLDLHERELFMSLMHRLVHREPLI
jgi:MarR family transcriptional regulator, lower aerobic nicotinate degradation pathway regulator